MHYDSGEADYAPASDQLNIIYTIKERLAKIDALNR